MNPAAPRWHEKTRTRFFVGTDAFTFTDGPGAGVHRLDVGAGGIPASFAVLDDHAQAVELIYARHPLIGSSPRRWVFVFVRVVAGDRVHITCPACGRTSYHPMDRQHGWCASCSGYTQLGAHEHQAGQPGAGRGTPETRLSAG